MMDDRLRDRLEKVLRKFEGLEEQLGCVEVIQQQARYREVAKQRSALAGTVGLYRDYLKREQAFREAQDILRSSGNGDESLKQLAQEEIDELAPRLQEILGDIRVSLIPRDPLDEKNIIIEVRAGTGGEEAALFAGDLYRMYSKFAESRGWRLEMLEASPTGIGGYKNIVAAIQGESVYSLMKYESGVHRVQRVPVTEASGRIHTSAVTVAVLPEAEEVEVDIRPEDLEIQVCRASGPGGQSVNTTDSAVRIMHRPTGMSVSCQDEKSQHKNKAKAMRVLRARLLDMERSRADAERAQNRKSQIGSGDRSERIRTYNFPQGRLTDHRINLTLYQLQSVMDGELGEVVSSLQSADQERLLTQE